MLQSPSKYHSNPLSHFLALHNSQVAQNAIATSQLASASATTTTTTADSPLHQQQLTQFSQNAITANSHHFPLNSAHHHISSQALSHPHSLAHSHPHSHLLDPSNTSLDVGKSFTIAAILGLQKGAALDSGGHKDYNRVINLSLNANTNNNNIHESQQYVSRNLTKMIHSAATAAAERENNKPNIGSINCNSDKTAVSVAAALVGNRYLPTANHQQHFHQQQQQAQQHQQQQQQQQHGFSSSQLRVSNSFAAAVAAVNNVTPSALQSLQQLHQHHAQQSNLSFQREKLKSGEF